MEELERLAVECMKLLGKAMKVKGSAEEILNPPFSAFLPLKGSHRHVPYLLPLFAHIQLRRLSRRVKSLFELS